MKLRKSVYKSEAWKDISKAYVLSKNCICERCGRAIYCDGISPYLPKQYRLRYVVHHKTYLNELNFTDKDIAYSNDNLELLCIDCHNKEHHPNNAVKGGFSFDEMGNLVQTN